MAAKLIVAKFGGSALGPDGVLIPSVIQRIQDLKRDGAKVISVFSAPLIIHNGKRRSLTDVVLELGSSAANGSTPSPSDGSKNNSTGNDGSNNDASAGTAAPSPDGNVGKSHKGAGKDGGNGAPGSNDAKSNTGDDAVSLDVVRAAYQKIVDMCTRSGSVYRQECDKVINHYLGLARKALEKAGTEAKFTDEIRSHALAFTGEILMSHVMSHVMRDNGIRAGVVGLEVWPIITDDNIEYTNFLASKSMERLGAMEELVSSNEVVCIGGFIGKTVDGVITTYERGGSDRTAADLGILFHKKYDTMIDFEKDSSVVSADPKIIESGLRALPQLSYNEARLAGMFGMKILDPIAIKEIVENGVDVPITITNMKSPGMFTTIKRIPDEHVGHPIKIVTGKENCAIFRLEEGHLQNLLTSLEDNRRYSEFVILSPFVRDGVKVFRILFLDGDYVRLNERYLRSFDPLATITYGRGVITLIGDEMWRVQHVVSRASSKVGELNLNILNLDAQEETSRIIIVIDDARDGIKKAIRAIHGEISEINFV